MPFNTLSFILFFILVFTAFRIAPTWRTKKGVLLFFSQIFYAAWNPPFVLLLWITTILSWWLALKIRRSDCSHNRKYFLAINLIANLGLLAYFKYGYFLQSNFAAALHGFGASLQLAPFNVILPAGISFYTFQAVSYAIDVYRNKIEATWSLTDYALYHTFFPLLVAGPIVRAYDFLPQLRAEPNKNEDDIFHGLALFFVGVFQKSVLADTVFAPVADQLFANPAEASAWDAWAGLLSFSGQIFFDFSGYSTCAIGLALCFGLKIPENFRAPYGAIGFSDFWRRWHISLSTWLRDYLYIPLGGNKGSRLFCFRNLMITMFLGGIWHGASWMFLLWGGLHGILLTIEHLLRPHMPSEQSNFSDSSKALLTFIVISLTWIPFRSADAETALEVAKSLFRPGMPELAPIPLALSLFGAMSLYAWHTRYRETSIRDLFTQLPEIVQIPIISACLIGVFLVSGGEPRGFIYFQF